MRDADFAYESDDEGGPPGEKSRLPRDVKILSDEPARARPGSTPAPIP